MLASEDKINLKVFYTWSQSKNGVQDKGFGKKIEWDLPLLEGYRYEFVDNKAKKPGSHHFFGINCPELIDKVKAFSPDVVLVFGWNFKSHFKLMRHFKGKVPVWFRGDSTLLDETNRFKKAVRRLVLKYIYRHVDKALYVGQRNRDYFLVHGLRSSQLVFAPHAIDNKRFFDDKKYEKKAEAWRKELGYKKDDVVILFVGKLESKKQPDLLLESVISYNKEKTTRVKLLVVGNGILESELKEKSKKYEFVKFLSFQNQSIMPLVYRLGDVFCLPSKGPGETWGLAINESMACGVPVIVSDKVGCEKDLVNDDVGYVFNYNYPNSLLNVLKNLDKKVLLEKGKEAQKQIQNYSFEEIVVAISKQAFQEIKKR